MIFFNIDVLLVAIISSWLGVDYFNVDCGFSFLGLFVQTRIQ